MINLSNLELITKILEKAVNKNITSEDFNKIRKTSAEEYLKQFQREQKKEVEIFLKKFLKGEVHVIDSISFFEKNTNEKNFFSIFLKKIEEC